ncbi:ATP-binding protein [Szabonella alba]|uniref:histidine kinase n=1 Tax=Szabonella alba TaxID=2804194 RepID=A0A8K0Y184_9RHOB|nr:ATP-binding protein [Szabonella alba]MBL4917883.1 PAS domain-containing protein [Szabonella alba]
MLDRILEAVPLPAVLVDREERLVLVNHAAETLLGTAAKGRLYPTALRQAPVQAAIEAALSAGLTGQARHVVQQGASETVYRVSVTAIEEGALCIFEDISEPEQIAQMRRDFVANVSHELRTPLTALLGFIETLQGAAREDPVARDRFLSVMAREAGRMNRLVGDLLSLSRVEAQERVRPTGQVDIAALIRRVASDLRPMAMSVGVAFDMRGTEGEVPLRGDADQLTQVLANLMENAVKYGAPGKTVHVDLSRALQEPGMRGPVYRIALRDEGEGIDPIHLPRLTERFYRVDSHRSREQGGTGLGLAIVKHILNRHRGRLRIESEPGKGSVFTVILPDDLGPGTE